MAVALPVKTHQRQTLAGQVADSRRLVVPARRRRLLVVVPALRQPLMAVAGQTLSPRLVTPFVRSMAAARAGDRLTPRLMVSAVDRCLAVVAVVTAEAKRRARRSLQRLAVAPRLQAVAVVRLAPMATLQQQARVAPTVTSSEAVRAAAVVVAGRSPLQAMALLAVPVVLVGAVAEEAVLLTCRASVGPVVSVGPVPFS